MFEQVTIYHNPRCSKSRQTLALLEERGVAPTIVEYLSAPLDVPLIRDLLKKLNLNARDLMRTKESAYIENNLSSTELTEEDLIRAMIEHPKTIERPIVVRGDKAVLGRPPENIEYLF